MPSWPISCSLSPRFCWLLMVASVVLISSKDIGLGVLGYRQMLRCSSPRVMESPVHPILGSATPRGKPKSTQPSLPGSLTMPSLNPRNSSQPSPTIPPQRFWLLSLFVALFGPILAVSAQDNTLGLPAGVTNSQAPTDIPLTPAQSLSKITVPKGFRVSLFAGEPHVHQPIAFTFDDRGRMWVAQCYTSRVGADRSRSHPDF